MTITCAIIDDEPLAAGLLESYVKRISYLKLKGVYNSAVAAMKDLRDDPVLLLFLDIQMPDLSGVEFAKIVHKDTRIIFTTAFSQYAVESYKVNALDYLLKPISYQSFLEACDKALDYFSVQMRQAACFRDRYMFVKSDYKLVRIRLDDLLYIEGFKDYVRFVMKDGEKVHSLMSMKRLDEYLPKPEFLRIHRSYIVHMPEVEAIDRFRIVFGETFLPISDNYKDELQIFFDQHTLA